MGNSLPPPKSRSLKPRRPWYLNVSLALAWISGAIAILMASIALSVLDYPADLLSLEFDKKTDLTADQRARQKASFEAYSEALKAARRRVMPLAVAELLLGGGMVLFAQRAAVGRSWARSALIQLTVAHVALTVVEWVLTPDLRKPQNDLQLALNNMEAQDIPDGASKLFSVVLWVGAGAVTVLGLTVRGSRTFYTTMEQVTEP